ncbi:uncharacterized protein LOC114536803 isoform X2 [Dendronephthya gigantea]|nr:uncharacterized protein LOC114536803 isoform X2 [Dendronephthya gigantea]
MTWFKVPHLWKFPHFIIVIMITQSTIIVSFVAVGILLGPDAFCSSKYLEEAYNKATLFCVLEGALTHYLAGSVSFWFVAYNVVIAKGLVFENTQRNERSKWPFIISAACCWILPVIPVAIVLTSSEGYAASAMTYCFPKSNEMTFYTVVLPENVNYAVGVSFLFVIVWKLIKERRATINSSRHQNEIRKSKMGNVVGRLSLLMIFYTATVYLTYGGLAYQLNKVEALKTSLNMVLHVSEFSRKVS